MLIKRIFYPMFKTQMSSTNGTRQGQIHKWVEEVLDSLLTASHDAYQFDGGMNWKLSQDSNSCILILDVAILRGGLTTMPNTCA